MSAETERTNVRTKYYIHCVIMFALMFIIASLPPFANITPLGMQVLGIFVAAAYGWCTVGLLWPSLFILIALGCTEYCTVKESFITGFGDHVVISIVAVFAFAAYLEESGLSQYIANWFISRKIGEGRPWVFTLLIFAAAYVLSAFVSLYATIVIMWSIFYKICESVGIERKSNYATMVICGIVITTCLTSTIFPFKPFTQVYYGLVMKATGITDMPIDFVPWTICNIVIGIVMIGLYILASRFIMRPDVTLVKEAGAKLAHLRNEKMNKDQKLAFVVLMLFVISQVLPSFLPKTMPLAVVLNNLSLLGCAVIALIVLTILRSKEGKPVIEVGHLISKGTNWDIIIMMAATMPLSAALESDTTGIIASVTEWMSTALAGVSPTMFLVLIVVVFIIATQFAHNLVLAMVLMPMLATLGLNYGIHPFVIINLVWFAAQSAFLLPASSSPSAMIYGNVNWISTKKAYMYDAMFVVLAMLTLIVVGIPLTQFLFPGM